MYAYFTPSTGSPQIALNDASKVEEDFYNFTDRSTKEIQTAQFLRAGSVQTFDRGNEVTDITAKFTKLFSTLDAGTIWLVTTRAALSMVGLVKPYGKLTFVARNFTGSTHNFDVHNACVTLTLERQIGVSFEFSIHVQGGRLI